MGKRPFDVGVVVVVVVGETASENSYLNVGGSNCSKLAASNWSVVFLWEAASEDDRMSERA